MPNNHIKKGGRVQKPCLPSKQHTKKTPLGLKLWQKISLVCVVVLILVVSICSTILLVQSKNSILELTIKQADEKQRVLETSFTQMLTYYNAKDDSETTKSSLAVYCFSMYADKTSVLIMDGKTVYSDISLLPENILPVTDFSQKTCLKELDGRNILIVGSNTVVNDADTVIYVVEDISTVYNGIIQMMWKFVLISAAGVLLGTALIIFLVRRATKPLSRLSETTKRISAGEYGERAVISSRDEVGALAVDFNAMADAVENRIGELTEITQRQRLFIGGVTHEFKTPLATMLIHADTLLNANMDQNRMNLSLEHIREQCKWLERMTQKLLRLITLKETIIPKQASVRELFASVRESTAGQLAERETPLKIDCDDDYLPMDSDLMRSALINLVDNASKASAKGQTVTLRYYDSTIEVSDNGAGIPQSEIERITEPFYMVDPSRNKKKGGSGLGLALVSEIVRAHKAVLDIESEIGRGTSVKIIFPDNNSITF